MQFTCQVKLTSKLETFYEVKNKNIYLTKKCIKKKKTVHYLLKSQNLKYFNIIIIINNNF